MVGWEGYSDIAFFNRRGATPLVVGAGLFVMAMVVYVQDFSLIEGPPEEELIKVSAVFLEGGCGEMRTSSYGAAQSSTRGCPEIRYKYIFNGVEYVGYRFIRQRNTPIGSMDECLAYVESLKSASSIECWVDPRSPEFSVLSKQLRGKFLENMFFAVAAMLVWVGLRGLWLSRKVE